MNKLTKTVAFMLALTALSTAFAQTPGLKSQADGAQGGGQGRMGRMMEVQNEIFAKLNLNKNQTKEIDELNKSRAEKMKANGEKAKASGQTSDREKMRAQFQKAREEYNAKLKAILGDKKFAKYEDLMKEKMKALRAKGAGGGGAKSGKGGGK